MVKPPKEAQRLAREALRLRETLPPSRQCCTDTGIAQAKRIAAGLPMEPRLIYNWFARHSLRIIEAELAGKTAATSKAIQAAHFWGGWPMYHAVAKSLASEGRD